MELTKPYYTAAVNACGSGFDIRVNDCPVASHRKRALSTVVPLNEWIHNGPNELSLRLAPLPREEEVRSDAELNVDIRVREDDDTTQHFVCGLTYHDRQVFVRRQDSPDESVPIETHVLRDGAVTAIQPIFMRVPFGPWQWQSAPIFQSTSEMEQALLAEIDKLHGLFAAEDFDAVLELCRERSNEWASAYYGTYEDAVEATQSTFESICFEPTFSLQPPTTERLKLNVYGHGRLAYLTNHLDESTLFYADQDLSFVGQLKFIFRLNEERQWLICR